MSYELQMTTVLNDKSKKTKEMSFKNKDLAVAEMLRRVCNCAEAAVRKNVAVSCSISEDCSHVKICDNLSVTLDVVET